jgi:hypothetical protein
VVVLLDQAATRRRAWALVVKCSSWRSWNSTVECQLSMTALSRQADSAHRLGDLHPVTGGLEVLRGVLAALVGVHDDVADGVRTATDGDRHLQRRVARSASWCSPKANPRIRREPMSNTESRNSVPSSVGISVPSPYHLWLSRSCRSPGRSGPPPATAPDLAWWSACAAGDAGRPAGAHPSATGGSPHGKPPGPSCSPTAPVRQPPALPDHPARNGATADNVEPPDGEVRTFTMPRTADPALSNRGPITPATSVDRGLKTLLKRRSDRLVRSASLGMLRSSLRWSGSQ